MSSSKLVNSSRYVSLSFRFKATYSRELIVRYNFLQEILSWLETIATVTRAGLDHEEHHGGLPSVDWSNAGAPRQGQVLSLKRTEENERGVCPREPPGSSFSPSRNVILPLALHVPPSSSPASVAQMSPLYPPIGRPCAQLRLLQRPSSVICTVG